MHIYIIGVSQDPGTRCFKLAMDSEAHDGHIGRSQSWTASLCCTCNVCVMPVNITQQWQLLTYI